MKLGIYNYVWGATRCGNLYDAATTWMVLANTWLVTRCSFLVYLFLFFFFYCILGLAHSPHSWTDFDDLMSYDVSAQGSAFWWSRWDCSPLTGSNPQKTNFGGIFNPKSQYIKTCILSWVVQTCTSQIQDGRRPPSWKIAATVWPTATKFGTVTQFHPLDHSDC